MSLFSFSSALLLLLTSTTYAAPTSSTGEWFKVHKVATGSYKSQTGNLAIYNTYRKHGWEVPDGLSQAAATTWDKITQPDYQAGPLPEDKSVVLSGGNVVGSVTVQPDQAQSEYLAPVTIGGQTLMLDLDTGSSDLWVFNTDLKKTLEGSSTTSSAAQKHTYYDPTSSRDWKPRSDLKVKVAYGDNTTMEGPVGGDTVQIGAVTVYQQAVALPQSVSVSMVSDNSDGILGLGFMSMNKIKASATGDPYPQHTWLENALAQLQEPLFTANLKIGQAGYFNFGTIDHTSYRDGTLHYVPLDNSTGYWGFESTTYAIGDGNFQTNNGAHIAVADTGASIFYLDPAVVNAYYGKVTESWLDSTTSQRMIPCSATLPDFHLLIGGQKVSVPGHMLVWQPQSQGSSSCIGGIQSNDGNSVQVYGDILFQLYFFIFDYGGHQIGFAEHA